MHPRGFEAVLSVSRVQGVEESVEGWDGGVEEELRALEGARREVVALLRGMKGGEGEVEGAKGVVVERVEGREEEWVGRVAEAVGKGLEGDLRELGRVRGEVMGYARQEAEEFVRCVMAGSVWGGEGVGLGCLWVLEKMEEVGGGGGGGGSVGRVVGAAFGTVLCEVVGVVGEKETGGDVGDEVEMLLILSDLWALYGVRMVEEGVKALVEKMKIPIQAILKAIQPPPTIPFPTFSLPKESEVGWRVVEESGRVLGGEWGRLVGGELVGGEEDEEEDGEGRGSGGSGKGVEKLWVELVKRVDVAREKLFGALRRAQREERREEGDEGDGGSPSVAWPLKSLAALPTLRRAIVAVWKQPSLELLARARIGTEAGEEGVRKEAEEWVSVIGALSEMLENQGEGESGTSAWGRRSVTERNRLVNEVMQEVEAAWAEEWRSQVEQVCAHLHVPSNAPPSRIAAATRTLQITLHTLHCASLIHTAFQSLPQQCTSKPNLLHLLHSSTAQIEHIISSSIAQSISTSMHATTFPDTPSILSLLQLDMKTIASTPLPTSTTHSLHANIAQAISKALYSTFWNDRILPKDPQSSLYPLVTSLLSSAAPSVPPTTLLASMAVRKLLESIHLATMPEARRENIKKALEGLGVAGGGGLDISWVSEAGDLEDTEARTILETVHISALTPAEALGVIRMLRY